MPKPIRIKVVCDALHDTFVDWDRLLVLVSFYFM